MADRTHRRWSIGAYREFCLERLLDVNHFLPTISFYMLAKSGFQVVIFKEAIGVRCNS
jgi:hypothetical protein